MPLRSGAQGENERAHVYPKVKKDGKEENEKLRNALLESKQKPTASNQAAAANTFECETNRYIGSSTDPRLDNTCHQLALVAS
jgi:hypothetical protein